MKSFNKNARETINRFDSKIQTTNLTDFWKQLYKDLEQKFDILNNVDVEEVKKYLQVRVFSSPLDPKTKEGYKTKISEIVDQAELLIFLEQELRGY